MFSLVRKVVAGPKRTTIYEGRQLDLTYISERIIAMAFPASDMIEKTYRNKIEDVAKYLGEGHGEHYLVLNVSSRIYDYSPFEERVRDYQWADHQAPTLTTLVHIAHQVAAFLLAHQDNVVAVHCNHGKGRTGTAIISFLLFIGYYDSTADCLKFYNERRFSKDTYGVDQPCQVRYLNFIEKIMKSPKIAPKLICYRLQKITHRGLSETYYVKIRNTRSQETIFQRVSLNEQLGQFSNRLLISDIFIEIFNDSWMGQKKVARINYNLYFTENSMNLTFKGKDIKLSGDHSEVFEITFHLQYYCLCHLPTYQHTKCNCEALRNIEEDYWAQMINHIREIKNMPSEDRFQLVHGKRKQDSRSSMRGKRESNESSSEEVEVQNREFKKKKNKEFKNSHQEKLYALVQNTKSKKMIFEEQDSKDQVNQQTEERSPSANDKNPPSPQSKSPQNIKNLSLTEQ